VASYSGLDKKERLRCRELIANAAWLAYEHRSAVHYTQGAKRWDGINKDLKAYQGEYPKYADCSSLVTWCLWNGLDHFHLKDIVNGAAWKAGYTGTMLQHGKVVKHKENFLRGDCVIYGNAPGKHTAIIVGAKNGVPMVISHGSESGPHYIRWDYRSDINCVRRYV
jgi:hypothetical protein